MIFAEEDVKKWIDYSRYLDRIRSHDSFVIKGKYFILYNIIIPVFRVLLPLMKLFVWSPFKKEECDILVLGTCKRDIEGSMDVWHHLENKGFNIRYFYVRTKREYFLYPFFIPNIFGVPGRIFFYVAFAKYLIRKYDPKLIANFHGYDVLPSILRRLLGAGSRTVFIPHAMTPITYLYTSVDFDYYFLFGRTSQNNLSEQPLRIGNTKIVRVGSPMIKKDFYLPRIRKVNNSILYFSNWLVGVHPEYTRDFEIVLNWAVENPEYSLKIKLHPVENEQHIKNLVRGVANIEVLRKDISIKDALQMCSLSVVAYSVSAIESALMNRPLVVANFREFIPTSENIKFSDKYLFMEKYFPPRARNAKELQERIAVVYKNYDHYVSKCRQFVNLHLEHTTNSNEIIASTIENIFRDNVDFKYTFINESLKGLKEEYVKRN